MTKKAITNKPMGMSATRLFGNYVKYLIQPTEYCSVF